MKISSSKSFLFLSRSRFEQGMTLVEMMVSMVIFTFVILGLVYVHIFGLRYDSVIGSKLGASDQSRMAFGHMLAEIRAATSYRIGSISGTNFTGDVTGTSQQGNTLRLYATTNLNSYVQYALDTSSSELHRTQTGFSGYETTAQYLTNTASFGANSNIFVSEDFLGAVQTTINYKYLIHITLQFYMYKYPKTPVGPHSYYDYYKLEFKAAPRAP
jgi:prepilin-type N-terminal cleavage/methylation domain-containing protein